MTVRVLALQSGVTTLEDHRLLISSLVTQESALNAYSGIIPAPSAAALTTVSAMTARVAPFSAVIDGTAGSLQGGYVFVADASTDIVFADGEPSVARVDRIIAHVYHDAYDATGQTVGAVEYLQGQATGSATTLPDNALLLYEVTVPAGTSAGGGGINFSTAVDKRVYTAGAGGVLSVASVADLPAGLAEGTLAYTRLEDRILAMGSLDWYYRNNLTVSSSAALPTSNVATGSLAVTTDTFSIYIFNGSSWDIVSTPPTTLTTVTYQNGWIDYGGTTLPVAYWKDSSGTVHIQGTCKGGTVTSGTVIFNLPLGFRPAGQVIVAVDSYGAYARISIASTGDCTAYGGVSASGLSLDGTSFMAA